MIQFEGYTLIDPYALETPAMLVFDEHLEHNITSLCAMVGGGHNLMVHVKTHKSAAVTRRLLRAGVAGFKCATIAELEMCLRENAPQVILSYPLAHRLKITRFFDLASAYPETDLSVIASAPIHLELLEQEASTRARTIEVLIDIDVGMHRTGIEPGTRATALYRAAHESPHLTVVGLHVYDGHQQFDHPDERHRAVRGHIETITTLRDSLVKSGMSVERIVCGGSFSFSYYAGVSGMLGSPGTCTYWDFEHSRLMPDMPFHWASAVLTQVVDHHPHLQTITTDLGSKGISADKPLERRAYLMGIDGAMLVSQSEEHGIFHMQGRLPPIGSMLLAVPGHICTTTILYPGSHLIDREGKLIDYYIHTARDRT